MADDLWQQHSNIINTIPFKIQSDQGPLDGQATIVGLSVSSKTAENSESISEFYVVEQVFNINPSQMYQLNDDVKGYYLTDITIETFPVNYENQPYILPLLSNSPSTTIGSTTYTTSTSYSFGGSIGVMGDQLTASASGSYTVSHSTSVNISDVSVENNSLTKGNNAVWKFTFNNNPMGFSDGNAPTAASITNFQPTVNSMWELKNANITSQGTPVFKTRITMNFIKEFTLRHVFDKPPLITDNMWEEYQFQIRKPVSPLPDK